MAFPKILPVLVCLCLAAVAQAENPPAAEVSPEQVKFFESKIRPLLVEHCLACHGAEKQSGGLRLDLKTSALGQGGESGPAIVPGHPEESLLLEAVRYESFEMPPEGPLPGKAKVSVRSSQAVRCSSGSMRASPLATTLRTDCPAPLIPTLPSSKHNNATIQPECGDPVASGSRRGNGPFREMPAVAAGQPFSRRAAAGAK